MLFPDLTVAAEVEIVIVFLAEINDSVTFSDPGGQRGEATVDGKH